MTIWILVADENRGRILATDTSTGTIVERQDLVHPESKLSERKLTSDSPGRNKSNGNNASHGVNEAGNIKAHHAKQFAKEIALVLKNGQQENKFHHLILVAAPKFLGALRKEIDGEVKKRICLELDKDLTKLKVDEIRDHLPKRLPINDRLAN